MSNETTKRELVELLVKHLPPLSDAAMNLSKIISLQKSPSLTDLEEEVYQTLMSNLKAAIKSLRELMDRLREISAGVKDREMILFFKELHEGVVELNLAGIEGLTQWLSGDEEVDLKEIVHKLFLGSQSISQLVDKLTK